MCVIAVKKAGVEMPDATTRANMFNNNPDGAGFMWSDGSVVHIEKGFMTLDEFETALAKISNPRKKSVVMHFRIATHGGVNRECTHPFPVTADIGRLKKLQATTRMAVAHNGIISSVTPHGKNVSDTMEYISSVLAPLYSVAGENLLKNKQLLRLIDATIGSSRLAFLKSSGEVTMLGDFTEHNGVYYSNTSYLPRVSTYAKYDFDLSKWSKAYGNSYDTGYYTYQMKLLNFIDIEGADGYGHLTGILNSDGETVTLEDYDLMDFALDKSGSVWMYEQSMDAYVPFNGELTVFGDMGLVTYNPDLADWMDCYDEGGYMR